MCRSASLTGHCRHMSKNTPPENQAPVNEHFHYFSISKRRAILACSHGCDRCDCCAGVRQCRYFRAQRRARSALHLELTLPFKRPQIHLERRCRMRCPVRWTARKSSHLVGASRKCPASPASHRTAHPHTPHPRSPRAPGFLLLLPHLHMCSWHGSHLRRGCAGRAGVCVCGRQIPH